MHTFRAAFLASLTHATAQPVNPDDYIDQWHTSLESSGNCSLAEFLGLSDAEYGQFVEGGVNALQALLLKTVHSPLSQSPTMHTDDEIN